MDYQDLRQQIIPRGPVIDIHVHPVGDMAYYGISSPAEDAQRMVEAGRRVGIVKFCVSSLGPGYPLDPDMDLCRRANEYVLRLRDQAPEAILPFCYVILEQVDEAIREIERCVGANQMVGIKLWVSRRAADPALDPVMELAGRYGIPVLQHAWLKTTGNLPGESTPADVAHLARRHPGVLIIMAHLNGANPRGLEAVRNCPNVIVDTSGGDPESGMVELAAARLGPERVIFGSDAPGRHFGVSLAKVLGAQVSAAEKQAICWDNAVRLLPPWTGVGRQEANQ